MKVDCPKCGCSDIYEYRRRDPIGNPKPNATDIISYFCRACCEEFVVYARKGATAEKGA